MHALLSVDSVLATASVFVFGKFGTAHSIIFCSASILGQPSGSNPCYTTPSLFIDPNSGLASSFGALEAGNSTEPQVYRSGASGLSTDQPHPETAALLPQTMGSSFYFVPEALTLGTPSLVDDPEPDPETAALLAQIMGSSLLFDFTFS